MRVWFFLLVALSRAFADDLRCMNFYGLCTERMDFVCSWEHPPTYYLQILKDEMKLNTIRLPISHDYIETRDYSHLDSFITECNRLGFKVILDWHRNVKTHQATKPDEGLTLPHFIGDWIYILTRYQNDPSLFGVGIFNEIQHEPLEYVINIHTQVIETIESVFPGRFRYFAGCTEWGGNCMGMGALMTLPEWDRIYIEVHKYIFSAPNTIEGWNISIPDGIPADHWFIGEMGWKQGQSDQLEWAHRFIDYLRMRKIRNACAWTIAHSGDTEGWWKDDCKTFDYEKSGLFQMIWN